MILGAYQGREMAMMSRGRTCWQLASAALCQGAGASRENATAKRAERTVMVRKPAASTCSIVHHFITTSILQNSANDVAAQDQLCP